jgi:formylglycine-generating enzyme required for sulfatase activity
MSYIFISYSKHNRDYVRKLADQLLKKGFDIWIDDRINYGADWELEIFKAIDECTAFVVIMTPDSYESRWVRRECHHAEKRNKPPFPVLLDGEEFPRYGPTQYVDVHGEILPPESFYEQLALYVPRKSVQGIEVTAAETPDLSGLTAAVSTLSAPDLSHILVPPFEWCEIAAGDVQIEDASNLGGTRGGLFRIDKFFISKYPITNVQYQVFVNSEDGYQNTEWWRYSVHATEWRKNHVEIPPYLGVSDHPVTNICWFEAIAFCRWLTDKINLVVTLPSEQQWQRAAQGDDHRIYAWGNTYDATRANTEESGINGTTPVTRYSAGASPSGVMDMCGNVWELTVTEWGVNTVDIVGPASRIVRGGSHRRNDMQPRVTSRAFVRPDSRDSNLGFRIASDVPSSIYQRSQSI